MADRAVDSTVVTAYFAALAAADARAATAVVRRALAHGDSPKQLMTDVLAPAQRETGQLWMTDKWTVADQHAATSITEQVLTLLTPAATVKPATKRVVFACAEGEWHSLPARLAGELARSDDLEVAFLGGGTPAGQLQRHLREHPPQALALSVTMPTNLIAASRSIRAAHAEGVPVVVGGAAWGQGRHRARKLGAQIRLDDPRDLFAVLEDISIPAEGHGPPEILVEALLLDVPAREPLMLALERQCAGSARMGSMTSSQRDLSITDLEWLARHAAASVACDDPAIVGELLAWRFELLVPRKVPAAELIDSCYYLADAIEPEAPLAAGILRQEADHARQGPDQCPRSLIVSTDHGHAPRSVLTITKAVDQMSK